MRHLTGTPLAPGIARELAAVYLVKGALASTAIEGNTLTEEEARQIYDGNRRLPPSQQYLQVEIENVLAALARLADLFAAGNPPRIEAHWIREQNHLVLTGLDAWTITWCRASTQPSGWSLAAIVARHPRTCPC